MFPCRKHEGVFCQYLLWEHGCMPGGGKSPKLCTSPKTGPPWRLLTLRMVHPEPPAFCQQQLRLPWHWIVWWFWLGSLLRKRGLPVLPVCLSNSGGSRLPCVLPSRMRSKKSWWFFHLFSFLLVRMQWLLPSYLHAQLKTESPHASFSYTCMKSVWVGAVTCTCVCGVYVRASGHPIVMALLAKN